MQIKAVEERSTHPFDETLKLVTKAIRDAGMTIFAEIDHTKAAGEHGLVMPQTRVLIYGNPKAGTPVMLDVPLIALDLPLRVLVRELPGNTSAIAFHPVSEVFAGLGVSEQTAARFDTAQRAIANAAGIIHW